MLVCFVCKKEIKDYSRLITVSRMPRIEPNEKADKVITPNGAIQSKSFLCCNDCWDKVLGFMSGSKDF